MTECDHERISWLTTQNNVQKHVDECFCIIWVLQYMSLINRVNVCNNPQKHPSRSLHDTVVLCCGCAFISLPSAALIVCAAMGVAPVIWSIAAVYSLELGQSDPHLQVIDSAVILRLGKL